MRYFEQNWDLGGSFLCNLTKAPIVNNKHLKCAVARWSKRALSPIHIIYYKKTVHLHCSPAAGVCTLAMCGNKLNATLIHGREGGGRCLVFVGGGGDGQCWPKGNWLTFEPTAIITMKIYINADNYTITSHLWSEAKQQRSQLYHELPPQVYYTKLISLRAVDCAEWRPLPRLVFMIHFTLKIFRIDDKMYQILSFNPILTYPPQFTSNYHLSA